MDVQLPEHLNRLHLPFSWHVAAKLSWRVPGHRVYETAPMAGHYDCLSIRGAKLRVDINCGGSAHAHGSRSRDDEPPVPLHQVRELSLAPDGVDRAVAAVLARYGLSAASRRPVTTAEPLTYRVIAAALSMHFFRDFWDCRALVPAVESAEPPALAPAWDLAGVPANRIWMLQRNHETVAHLADGWAVRQDGERLNLLAAYDRGATVEELAARVTMPSASRASSVAVVAKPGLPQRSPEWPPDI